MLWWLIVACISGTLATTLPYVFVPHEAAAVPTWTITSHYQGDRIAVFVRVSRGEYVVERGLVGALEHVLGRQLARQLDRHAGRLRQLDQRPAADTVFIGIVQHAHDVDPRAAGGRRAAAELRIIAKVGRVKLERRPLHFPAASSMDSKRCACKRTSARSNRSCSPCSSILATAAAFSNGPPSSVESPSALLRM